MDYALAFGVGRQTAIRPNDITQTLPTEDDIRPGGEPHVEGSPRSPFIYAAKMMKSYGHLINMLNIGDPTEGGNMEGGINQARAQAMAAFNELPEDMQWNVGKWVPLPYSLHSGIHLIHDHSFQSQNRANQGSIFLHLHLWMHTILASRYLTDHSYGRREPRKPTATNGNGVGNGMTSGQATPQTMTVNNMWRNSARTIGDILVLSDIINPFTYVALPFVNQAFYVAGSCYVKGESLNSHPFRSPPLLAHQLSPPLFSACLSHFPSVSFPLDPSRTLRLDCWPRAKSDRHVQRSSSTTSPGLTNAMPSRPNYPARSSLQSPKTTYPLYSRA